MLSSTVKLENWLALNHVPDIGPVRFQRYLQHDPMLQVLPRDIKPDWQGVRRDLQWLEQNQHAHIITLADAHYPAALKEIASAPPVLYVLGDARCLSVPQIAVVGSRHPSSLGIKHAHSFAQQLSKLGLVITSGLAVGIDAAGHRGALAASRGRTIAVLAHGMDMIYPPKHVDLAEQIVARGCLVSEFPIGVMACAWHFPRRNRIISGLSMGVLVVEATLNSGSLITARYAMDQGRDVFTIPGSILSSKVKGCHHLIRQGAKLVDTIEDVTEEYPSLLKLIIRDRKSSDKVTESLTTTNLSKQQLLLLDSIDYDPTSVDAIVGRTGLTINVVGALLLELELQGLIIAVPGGYARRV